MNNNDVLIYPVIDHDGIGTYCQKLIKNLKIDSITSKYKYFSPLQYFERVRKKYKVIHCPHILANPSVVNKSDKLILTIHDVAPLIINNLSEFQKSYYKYRLNFSVKNADFIIFDSYSAYNDCLDHFDINVPNKVINLAPKEYPSNFSNLIRKDFIHVGRRHDHKNIIRLINAYAMISNKINDNLLLIGKDSINDEKLLNLIRKLNLEDRVVFIPYLTDLELIDKYRTSKCLLFISLYEGYGLPVVEAMSNKCPVLLSEIPVFREITNSCAHFVDPFSIDNISHYLYRISTEHFFSHYHVDSAFDLVSKRSWVDVAKETLDVYKIFL